jgi:outer membrane receptor for ferrienterochelin and colicin
MKKTVILTGMFIVGLLFNHQAFAQNGSVSGQVKDSRTGETLPGATILIVGTTTGAITDFDGNYALESMASGNYDIRISFISYDPMLFTGVRVESGKNTRLDAQLTEATTQISEVRVVAVRRSDTEMSVLNMIRTNPLVANGISSKQISMSQDKDASEAIRRVPGITIIDNRFVVIRGLNQRYNNVWLNNTSAPSSEADSKAFSFDIIPTGMIDNLIIYKSSSPELPADFTGGFVSIRTKNMPEKNEYSLSFQGSVNPQSSFGQFHSYEGGRTDWLGIDNGTRVLPGYFPDNLQDASAGDQIELSKRLNNNWIPKQGITLPDSKLGFSMSHRIKIGKTSLGEITSINYSNSRNFIRSVNRSFSVYDYALDRPGMDFDFADSTYTQSINLGILNNWSWFLGNGNKIEFRNLLSNQGESSTLFRNGTEYYSNTVIRSFEYAYKSRLTYSGQLSGTHMMEKSASKIDWVIGYAYALRDEPDLRRIKQIKNDNQTDSGYGRYFLELPSNPLSSNAGRLFMRTGENVLSGGVNLEKKLIFGGFKPSLKAGAFMEEKSRTFSARKLGYIFSDGMQKDPAIQYLPIAELLSGRYFNSTTGIKLAEETSKSDSYSADNHHLAGYVSINLPITTRINLFTGLRMEKNQQVLSSYNRFQQPVTVDIDTLNLFPSANLTYHINSKNLIRIAYGKSVNRPEFREIAPFPFYDFRSNAVFSGNPGLNNAYIHNFDLRFESYPDNNEQVSFGVFYKRFLNPIEIKYIETGSGLEYSYHNAMSATNYGLEAEIRKSLGSDGWLQRMTVVLNGAYIRSRVDFQANSIEQDRPLAGQSPYVINGGLFYADTERSGLNFSLMYNVIGERIYIVGQPKSKPWEYIPNIYEMPRHLVDLMVSKKIGKYLEIRIGIRDLLNQPVVLGQSIETDVDLSAYDQGQLGIVHFKRDQIVREFRPGSYYSIGLKMDF